MKMRLAALGGLCVALGLGAGTLPARAASAADARANSVLAGSMDAVERGAFDDAVDQLELLADQGFVHPDASLARAYAYVERARSRAAQPGDLGRAVAALEEARGLGRDDDSVASALERIRSEIARRRSRESGAELVQRPRLGRAITGLLPEDVWAFLAAIGSLILTLGLAARSFVHRRGAEIAGAVGIAVGLLIGTIGGAFAAAARHYRISTRDAVVVTSEARWLDAAGRPLSRPGAQSNIIPEGARVHVRREQAGRYEVEWGVLDGWVNAAQVRLLATGRNGAP